MARPPEETFEETIERYLARNDESSALAAGPPQMQQETMAQVQEALHVPQVGDILEAITGDYEILDVRNGQQNSGIVVQARLKEIGKRFIPFSAMRRKITPEPEQMRAFRDILPQRTSRNNRWYLEPSVHLKSFEKVEEKFSK